MNQILDRLYKLKGELILIADKDEVGNGITRKQKWDAVNHLESIIDDIKTLNNLL